MSLLLEAYDRQRVLYHEYVKAARGEDLVGNQRINPAKVEQAREVWVAANDEMRALGNARDLALALQERVGDTTVKRGA